MTHALRFCAVDARHGTGKGFADGKDLRVLCRLPAAKPNRQNRQKGEEISMKLVP